MMLRVTESPSPEPEPEVIYEGRTFGTNYGRVNISKMECYGCKGKCNF